MIPATPDPTDSITVTRIFLGISPPASTGIPGSTCPCSFGVPGSCSRRWGSPTRPVGLSLLRNRNTGGDFVRQGKRFRFSATASPTLFAFFPGFGLASRIRHSLSPTIQLELLARRHRAGRVCPGYPRCPGQPLQLRSDATQTVSLGLSQTFEAKAKTGQRATPSRWHRSPEVPGAEHQHQPAQLRLRAGQEARSNGLDDSEQSPTRCSATCCPSSPSASPTISGRGPVGVDTSKFDPFLSNVSASFAISGNTLRVHRLDLWTGRQGAPRRGGTRCRPRMWSMPAGADEPRSTTPGMVPFSGGPQLLGQLQLHPVPHPADPRRGPDAGPAEPAVQYQLLAHSVLVAVLGVPVQHHRQQVRVAGRSGWSGSCTSGGPASISCGMPTATSRSTSRSI